MQIIFISVVAVRGLHLYCFCKLGVTSVQFLCDCIVIGQRF